VGISSTTAGTRGTRDWAYLGAHVSLFRRKPLWLGGFLVFVSFFIFPCSCFSFFFPLRRAVLRELMDAVPHFLQQNPLREKPAGL
jgi:hypothetical protein